MKGAKARLIQRCYKIARGRCHWCDRQTRIALHHGGELAGSNLATLDRVVPGARGGRYERANVVLACFACNTERGDMDYHQYRARKGLPPVAQVPGTAAERIPRTPPAPLLPFSQRP